MIGGEAFIIDSMWTECIYLKNEFLLESFAAFLFRSNSRGFRLLHLKISVYFLKYLLRVGIFYRIFKMDDFSPPKNMHYYKDKKLILVHRL